VSRHVIQVLSASGAWRVKNGAAETSYPNKDDAIAEARAEAKAIHDGGGLSQVLVQKADGTWQTEYTYGDDPRDIKG